MTHFLNEYLIVHLAAKIRFILKKIVMENQTTRYNLMKHRNQLLKIVNSVKILFIKEKILT